MLFTERLPATVTSASEEGFGHIYTRSENADRKAAPILFIDSGHNRSTLSRCINRHHVARTLSNNRRTLSLAPRETCFQFCFDTVHPITIRRIAVCPDNKSIGMHIHVRLKQNVKIKCDSYPKPAIVCLGGLFTPPMNHQSFKRNTTQLRSILI